MQIPEYLHQSIDEKEITKETHVNTQSMRLAILLLISLSTFINVSGQEYKVTTTQTDSFSKSLIQLLQCASGKFETCKGKLFQYTTMQENEYELTIPFPGSVAGIVRFGNWDKNAYVEFRDFDDKKSLLEGMQILIDKIKKALDDQIIESEIAGKNDDAGIQIANIAIKDSAGYFQSNIELLTGSSSQTYLLPSPDNEKSKAAKKYFILMKIYGGTPSYYYDVPADVVTPDKKMDDLLKLLLLAATNDFDSLASNAIQFIAKKKYRDTIIINGEQIFINTLGQNASCKLQIPLSNDSLEFKKQIYRYRLIIEASVGSGYAYQVSETGRKPEIVYFPKRYNISKPSVELNIDSSYKTNEKVLSITIRSNNTKAVKRNLEME